MTQPAEKRAEHSPDKWFVRDCPHAYGDIEVVLGNDFTIYIPLKATDWDDAKRSRMRGHANLIAAAPDTAAERDRLKAANAELVSALGSVLPLADAAAGNVREDRLVERATVVYRAALAKQEPTP